MGGEAVIVDHLRLPVSLFPDPSAQLFQNRESTIYGYIKTARHGYVSVIGRR